MDRVKVRIVWNGQGGELDSVVIPSTQDGSGSIAKALIKMIEGNIVDPGDSFEVRVVE